MNKKEKVLIAKIINKCADEYHDCSKCDLEDECWEIYSKAQGYKQGEIK